MCSYSLFAIIFLAVYRNKHDYVLWTTNHHKHWNHVWRLLDAATRSPAEYPSGSSPGSGKFDRHHNNRQTWKTVPNAENSPWSMLVSGIDNDINGSH